jgi:hypothetical protein
MITVVTPIYINTDDRLRYFRETIESFYEHLEYDQDIIHNLVNDRSDDKYTEDIQEICEDYNINIIHTMPSNREYFSDVIKILLSSVDTEYYLYLEPDYHFYLNYDYITPILKLYEIRPELHQVYLRHGIHNNKGRSAFKKLYMRDDKLITPDNTILNRHVIDDNNVGWTGKGTEHETFSTNPSIFKLSTVLPYFSQNLNFKTPGTFETHWWREWENKKEVGYLNGQSFCYHIGKLGGLNNNKLYAALEINDIDYESVYSNKFV